MTADDVMKVYDALSRLYLLETGDIFFSVPQLSEEDAEQVSRYLNGEDVAVPFHDVYIPLSDDIKRGSEIVNINDEEV